MYNKNVQIESDEKSLPETIQYYNSHKFGVDIADKMLKDHSTKVPSRRWPLSCFFNLFDMTLLNGYIIYKEVNGSSVSRLNYLRKMVEELTEIIYEDTVNNAASSSSLVPSDLQLESRKKCTKKTFCRSNTTSHLCVNCRKAVCGPCSFSICLNCKKTVI
jgi:hypothetical protein